MVLRDSDIREPLFDFLETTYGKIRILEEKTMGKSRADVVMVTENALVGMEIKSDADSYTRLARQVKDYDKYYDYNYAVVGTSHAMHIREHIPDYWGVITVEVVDGEFDFYTLRKPLQNPKAKMEQKLRILWRPELALLQRQNGMPAYAEKSKDFVIKKIAERDGIDKADLNRQISNILFERDYNEVEELLRAYKKDKLLEKLKSN